MALLSLDYIRARVKRGEDAPPFSFSKVLLPLLQKVQQDVDLTPATGWIQIPTGASTTLSGGNIVVSDGKKSITFGFMSATPGFLFMPGVTYTINQNTTITQAQRAELIAQAIRTTLNMKATVVGTRIYLETKNKGLVGNVPITTTLATVKVSGMSGGMGQADPLYLSPGGVASATLRMDTNPTAGDTIGIGSNTYEFRAGAGSLGADANIAVEIGGSAFATLSNLIQAVNGRASVDNAHPTIFKSDGETPAKSNGTAKVVADYVSLGGQNRMRIRTADAAGGNPTGHLTSTSLAVSLTAAASVWDIGNVSLASASYGAAVPQPWAPMMTQITVSAAMVTTGWLRASFPFPVRACIVQVRTSAGLLRGPMATDAVSIDNGDVKITLTDSDASDIDATNIVTIFAAP